MNIAIVEMIRKANEESFMILKNTSEQSIKRRQQITTYNYITPRLMSDDKHETLLSKLILRLKSIW